MLVTVVAYAQSPRDGRDGDVSRKQQTRHPSDIATTALSSSSSDGARKRGFGTYSVPLPSSGGVTGSRNWQRAALGMSRPGCKNLK